MIRFEFPPDLPPLKPNVYYRLETSVTIDDDGHVLHQVVHVYERHYAYCAIVRAGFSEYIHVELTRAHDLVVIVREWLTRLRREQAVTLSPTIQLYVRELERVLEQR